MPSEKTEMLTLSVNGLHDSRHRDAADERAKQFRYDARGFLNFLRRRVAQLP